MLTYRLTARGAYALGDPAIIGFSLENASSADAWVLKWYTPLEGFKGKFLTLRCAGVEIPYRGRMMKRGQPSRDDYVQLHGGTSVQAEIDLLNAYSLAPCDECRVSFGGRIHDVVLDARQVPRAKDEHRGVDASGNDAVFRVTAARRAQ